MNDDDMASGRARQFASSPCMMHELDESEAATGASNAGDDVAGWRRAERKRQIQQRQALDAELRQRYAAAIARHLEDAIGDVAGLIVSCYWPMRAEPDLRPFMDRVAKSGGRCALPVVTEGNRALTFRTWHSGERLERGFWNILVPAGGDDVVPDIVIAPVVAFDRARFRLGYGGGYFDRTLCELTGSRRVFGIGYSMAAIATIYPQPHDIPMDAIVTESGVNS
jgi:5-formyltetrahydrofolate cyclo-ligase